MRGPRDSNRRDGDAPEGAGELDTTPLLSPQASTEQYTSLPPPAEPPASWSSIPRKGQLAVIVFARLAEPLSERSLTSYLFYQLQWFNPSLEAPEIAKQAGYLTAVFAAAQCLTSMWWGRAADNPRLGRKRVLVIGLMGSALSALGMGFATSLPMAFFFRFMAGALNGNVGVLRTMISEIVVDKRHQSRAFLLLPMCFNVGVIIGPLLSGFLADPIHSLPSLFGPGSFLGGGDGVHWMKSFPYALPNLLFTFVLSTAAMGIILGLDETHPQLRHKRDSGRRLGRFLLRMILPGRKGELSDPFTYYEPLSSTNQHLPEVEAAIEPEPLDKPRPPFSAILTRNVCLTMLQCFLQTLHVSAFNSIFFSLLPTPRGERENFHLPFRFTGGLGLSTVRIGFANTTIGMIGIPLQIIIYPMIIGRMGVKDSYRTFLPFSIGAYCLLPFVVLLPENPALIWSCLSVVLAMHVLSRTFVNPATVMLVNNSSPDPNLLGSVHGFAISISSAARIVGPTMGGTLLGWGLSHNFVGLPLWLLTILAITNLIVISWIEDIDMST